MTIIEKIKAEIERRITDNTFGAKLELIDILAWLDTLESEKPINPEAAMKELDEKIALVKQRGTWDGVDVDKYMDEVRGREPEKPMQGLEEEIVKVCDDFAFPLYGLDDEFGRELINKIARHFAQWGAEHSGSSEMQKEQMMKEAVEGDAVKKSIIIEGKEYSDWLGLGHSVWDKIVDLNWYGSPYKGEQIRIIIVKED